MTGGGGAVHLDRAINSAGSGISLRARPLAGRVGGWTWGDAAPLAAERVPVWAVELAPQWMASWGCHSGWRRAGQVRLGDPLVSPPPVRRPPLTIVGGACACRFSRGPLIGRRMACWFTLLQGGVF